jgi:tetratricopeptide (TPR) repeat protein
MKILFFVIKVINISLFLTFFSNIFCDFKYIQYQLFIPNNEIDIQENKNTKLKLPSIFATQNGRSSMKTEITSHKILLRTWKNILGKKYDFYSDGQKGFVVYIDEKINLLPLDTSQVSMLPAVFQYEDKFQEIALNQLMNNCWFEVKQDRVVAHLKLLGGMKFPKWFENWEIVLRNFVIGDNLINNFASIQSLCIGLSNLVIQFMLIDSAEETKKNETKILNIDEIKNSEIVLEKIKKYEEYLKIFSEQMHTSVETARVLQQRTMQSFFETTISQLLKNLGNNKLKIDIKNIENIEKAEGMLIELLNDIGVGYYESGNYDSAILVFNEILRYKNKEERAYVNRGEIYIELNKIQEAQADFKKALTFYNKNDLYYPVVEANFFYTNADYEKAIDFYTQGIVKDPENTSIYYLRGRAYEKLGMLIEAKSDYEKSLKENKVVPYINKLEHIKKLQESIQIEIQKVSDAIKKVEPLVNIQKLNEKILYFINTIFRHNINSINDYDFHKLVKIVTSI